jgi:protoporphyrinogen oxidase
VGDEPLREAAVRDLPFKAYTEKVWGISCSELKAEWAAQRIKDLSLRTALLSMFLKPKTTIKTLIEEFDYPRYGPGMMWNAVKSEIERRAGTVLMEAEVVRSIGPGAASTASLSGTTGVKRPSRGPTSSPACR